MAVKSNIMFRPIEPDDEDFLYTLYAGTREEELRGVDWTDTERDTFLHMQFKAQHTHYQTHFSDADFSIIVMDKKPVGRLYLGRWENEFRLIDITILPEYRNQGLGQKLIEDILEEAATCKKPVNGHVEPFNPALRLYQRLGFVSKETESVYLFIEWTPNGGKSKKNRLNSERRSQDAVQGCQPVESNAVNVHDPTRR